MHVSERLTKVIAKFRLLCYVIGSEFMDPDYRLNYRTYSTIVLIVGYFSGTAYTLVAFKSEIKWRCLTSVGMGAQGAVKYWAALRYYKQAYDELQKIIQMYLKIQGKGLYTDKCKLLAVCINNCNTILNLYILVFAGGFVMLLAYPIVMYFAFDQKVFMVTMMIPGVDPYGQSGFVIHYICHTFMAIIACVGTPAADFYFILCIAHTYVYIEFLHIRIKEINNWLLDPETKVLDKEWHQKVTVHVNKILKKHQDLLIFMNRLDEFYFMSIAVHIGTATVSLGIALFLIVTVSISKNRFIMGKNQAFLLPLLYY
jgi:7tm Odorant receptor